MTRFSRLAKSSAYSSLNVALGLIGRRKSHRAHSAILTGSGRGGTTWLASVLSRRPRTQLLWEPLHPRNNPACRRHGFGWFNYPDDYGADVQERRRKYLDAVLNGSAVATGVLTRRHFRVGQLLRADTYLTKFVRFGSLQRWYLDQNPVPSVMLVRHPCAVVASRMEHGGWNEAAIPPDGLHPWLLRNYPRLARVFSEIDTREAMFVLDWCQEILIPLSTPRPWPWLVVSYEDLVTDFRNTLERICDHLGWDVEEEMLADQFRLSSTASQARREGQTALTSWKARLGPEVWQHVFDIAQRCGVTFYDEHGEFRPDGLSGFSREAVAA